MPTTLRRAATVLLLPLALAACSSDKPPATQPVDGLPAAASSPSPSPTPTGKLGTPFRNGSFEVTVTKVDTGVRQLDIDEVAKSGGIKPWAPKNSQYIVVHLTAKNVGNEPASVSVTDSMLVDDAGKSYEDFGPMIAAIPVGQGLGTENLQPGTSASGFVVFDVPASAGTPVTLLLQTDPYIATTNPPTSVSLR